ncbi:PREDICTED: uncharacterized protein LOC104590965 [Nelumbo nucifera]|uniref:Uncharacterized protein n=2 Tax=Nelumbo nucifera TaxID=4432 RepID=A0A822ZZN9_NELNU|nr:PREDICTED: uncharacterized protein LOC104590965 [Nelumbo nucifera]DAD48286.1 TPA_asm: hypothetical protein HUJ06_018223 [Nelumbo nucifera]
MPNGRCAEIAGRTAADCAVICCCCPCGLVNLLVLAVYKVPTGLCRRALRKHKKLKQRRRCSCGRDETEMQIHRVSFETLVADNSENSELIDDREVGQLEKEMLERFHNTGFWRSPSQTSQRE